jgi:RNA polymerase sigma factor for flagellar operon FliA
VDELGELWRRYRTTGDEKAYARIVLSHAPLARFVAGRMARPLPRSVDEQELIKSGLRGLLAAVKSFDPAGGVEFEAYALPRIKGAIIDGLRESGELPPSELLRAMVALDPLWDFTPDDPEGGGGGTVH